MFVCFSSLCDCNYQQSADTLWVRISLTVLFFSPHFQSYFYNDDTFNFNYAQAKAALGNFKEAEEVNERAYTELLFESFNEDKLVVNVNSMSPPGFSANSERKDQERLCLPQLAGTLLYVLNIFESKNITEESGLFIIKCL